MSCQIYIDHNSSSVAWFQTSFKGHTDEWPDQNRSLCVYQPTITCIMRNLPEAMSLKTGENSPALNERCYNQFHFTSSSRSHCSCDEEFHRCLRETHTIISKKIGTTYFDILRPQCFKLEYPVTRCIRYSRWLSLFFSDQSAVWKINH